MNAAHAIGYSQVGSKLVASDGTSSAQFGHSVSMSDDGTIVVIGGNKDNQVSSNSVGATWVFTGSNGAYTQFGNKLVGTGGSTTNANQGTSVAISGDGTTILTGGTKDATFGTAAGAAWVFTLVSGAWTQQAIISPNVTSAAFGASVSLSSDGNTALIGSTGSASPGASWVYVRQSGTWTLQQKLVGTGNSGNSVQGTSVALSSDGKTAVIGGPSDKPSTSTIGATWVFTRIGSTWTQAQKLVGTGTTGSSAQGTSVAVNYNGTRIFIGATGDNSNTGAVWVFDLNQNGTWLEQTRLPGVSSSSKFGTSVATNREGDLLIIGASAYGSSVGAVYIYQYSGGAWSEVSNSQFQGSGNTGSSNQGKSVAMSKDGTSVCFGGDNDNLVSGNAQGAVWSFQQQTSTPTTYTPTYSPTSLAPTSGGVARTSYIYEKLIDYNSVFPNYLQQQRWTEKTTDAFTFFKADPFLFFLDMGQDSRLTQFGTSQTRTWISGDQHLDNFGTVSRRGHRC